MHRRHSDVSNVKFAFWLGMTTGLVVACIIVFLGSIYQ